MTIGGAFSAASQLRVCHYALREAGIFPPLGFSHKMEARPLKRALALASAMVDRLEQQIVNRIVAASRPEKVVLFGSRHVVRSVQEATTICWSSRNRTSRVTA